MALIHRLIRRGFEQSKEFVLAPGAGGRAGAVAEYVGFHLDGLHAHHSSEDELLWPVLHERASMSDALITRMEGQHQGVARRRRGDPSRAAARGPRRRPTSQPSRWRQRWAASSTGSPSILPRRSGTSCR